MLVLIGRDYVYFVFLHSLSSLASHGTLTLWNCFPENQYDITVPETAYGYVMHRKRRQCIFASCDNLFLHVATLSFSNLAAAHSKRQDKCEIPTFYFLHFDASFFFFIPEQMCGKTKPRNLCALPSSVCFSWRKK